MATIYKTTGEQIEISPKNNKDFQLDELQEIVQGYIEIVNLNSSKIMVCNEEGAINKMPLNRKASKIYSDSIGECAAIFGDALVCDCSQVE